MVYKGLTGLTRGVDTGTVLLSTWLKSTPSLASQGLQDGVDRGTVLLSTSINPSSHNGLQRINRVDTGTDLKTNPYMTT